MRLFGKKNEPKVQETTYEIFGGFTISKKQTGYEIMWRSPQVTTVTVGSPPTIDEDVQTKQEGDRTQVLSAECKLKIATKEGNSEAHISKI